MYIYIYKQIYNPAIIPNISSATNHQPSQKLRNYNVFVNRSQRASEGMARRRKLEDRRRHYWSRNCYNMSFVFVEATGAMEYVVICCDMLEEKQSKKCTMFLFAVGTEVTVPCLRCPS